MVWYIGGGIVLVCWGCDCLFRVFWVDFCYGVVVDSCVFWCAVLVWVCFDLLCNVV